MTRLIDTLVATLGEDGLNRVSDPGGEYLRVELEGLKPLLKTLATNPAIGARYLSDITAVDYPDREKRFELVYTLYSFATNEWLRIKTDVAENEEAPSVTDIWEGAFYPESEMYDLFGINFAGNAFQRRIFLPEEYEGSPLRKDFVNPWEEINFKP